MNTTGNLTHRWNVVCRYCTEWDMPSGTKAQAAQTLRDSGWVLVGAKWACKACIMSMPKARDKDK